MLDSKNSTEKIVVVGAGPGGYAAAFLAADLGMDVSLVDPESDPGGVCLYRGCIPSKALLHVARVIAEAGEAVHWGIDFGKPKIDVDKMRAWKDSVIRELTGGLGQLSRQRKINFIQARARFVDAATLELERIGGGSERLSFGHAVVATGSYPAAIPALDIDSPRVLDSTTALAIEDVPKSLLVIGGGYIGLELGTVYATLGSKVTVVEMLSDVLPGADKDLVGVLKRRIETLFEAIILDTTVEEMTAQKNGVRITLAGKGAPEGDMIFEKVLVSVGRRPNTAGLGLENTRVALNDKGFIEVDAQRRTAEPSIFAIGDVVGEPMLAHKASHEGRVVAEVIAGKRVAFEPSAIPAVVFTDPEIAWCGVTESDARAQGRNVKVARFPWAASGRAKTLGRSDGMTKLIIDPGTERVLGVGIVGPGAGELIAEGVHAVEMAATAADLKLTIHPHPTLSETVMEAAEVFYGQSTHVFRPRRG
jgi:dihydrolipoamide dehydrogenase